MLGRLIQLLAITFVLAATVEAQSKPTPTPPATPNFAGTWTSPVDQNGRAVRGVYTVGQGFVVTQDDRAITVVVNSSSRQSVYNLDGSESQSQDGAISKIAWEGTKLVIKVTGSLPLTQTWELDATGNRLTVVSDLGGAATTTAIYSRKQDR